MPVKEAKALFYEKLEAVYPGLTGKEARIAEYILANRARISGLTSQKLAGNLGISQSTVIRFSQKLGYKSYQNLLLDLERSGEPGERLEEIQLTDSTLATNTKILNHAKLLLDLTAEVNPPGQLARAVELIQGADTIFCFGFLSTHSAAHHMNELLQLFGINSFCLDAFGTLSAMRSHSGGGLLIVFSKSGATDMTNRVVRHAKELGLKIIGVTSMAPNPMAPDLDVWLKTKHSPVRTRFLHYTETLPMFFLIDCIILNLYKQNFSSYSDSVKQHIAFTKGAYGTGAPPGGESQTPDL